MDLRLCKLFYKHFLPLSPSTGGNFCFEPVITSYFFSIAPNACFSPSWSVTYTAPWPPERAWNDKVIYTKPGMEKSHWADSPRVLPVKYHQWMCVASFSLDYSVRILKTYVKTHESHNSSLTMVIFDFRESKLFKCRARMCARWICSCSVRMTCTDI